MILSSDKEYKETKQIMLGKAVMPAEFRELADYIDAAFGVKPVNIIYDTINKGETPRLNICFEFAMESRSFADESGYGFDSIKQKMIAGKYREIRGRQKEKKYTTLLSPFFKLGRKAYSTEKIFVVYSAFEPVAKEEAMGKIRPSETKILKQQIGNSDIWEISIGFSAVTFFVYTTKQLKQYEKSDDKKEWADKFFDLLEPYNEFGYFKRDKFYIYLDSKVNFDTNYSGNWYYYYK